MFTPSVVAFDVETALTNGEPSTEYYRKDFRVISSAFAWRGAGGDMRSLFLEGEDEVRLFLGRLREAGAAVVCHNFCFEWGVTHYRFPGFEDLITHDTMRLTQVGDNGGRFAHSDWRPKDDAPGEEEASTYSSGLGLVSSVSRWLPKEWHSHKEPFYGWLREHAGARKGKEGASLTKLPPDMLEAYNVSDAVVTLLLYERLTAEFTRIGYDYRMDHELYKSTARMVAKAKGVGAKVDVEALVRYAGQVQGEVDEIETKFRAFFKPQIEALELTWTEEAVAALTSERGRLARRAALEATPIRFNLGSNKQLEELFVLTLGIKPKFMTKDPNPRKKRAKPFVPSPSFKSAHLSTYGEGGELLIKRRKRLLVLQQTQALIALSQYDRRWHPDIRACGTTTGRMAGGSGD